MNEFSQGDIIKINGFNYLFVIVSKNAMIRSLNMFLVCPLIGDLEPGPIHIAVKAKKDVTGTVLCEQIKLIDPESRSCSIQDRLPYDQIMEVSDCLQAMLEYD